jgi:hypothetical protein
MNQFGNFFSLGLGLHKWLRAVRYCRISRGARHPEKRRGGGYGHPYQYTVLITGVACRLAVALLTAAFLIAPLVLLAGISTLSAELMAVSAAYAAILSVFVSNIPVG